MKNKYKRRGPAKIPGSFMCGFRVKYDTEGTNNKEGTSIVFKGITQMEITWCNIKDWKK